jgi:ribosomal protein L11 methyltransferase
MKTHKAWVEIRVQVTRPHTEQLESLLSSQGALSITLTDVADTPVLEPGVGETPLWPEVEVTGLFDDNVDMDRLRAVASLAPGVDSATQIRFKRIKDQDWERAWMEGFKPMKFGRELWIVPGEQEAPETPGQLIRLDPGLAFGSGTHPTTRLCLEWIDTHSFEGKSVVDFGCGSGVLGIAAALKGAREVQCVDNDPQALRATRDNAQRNGVGENVVVLDASAFSDAWVDVILANILAGTLVELAPVLSSALKPGGAIALSGILPEQIEMVLEVYEPWLENMKTSSLDEWVLINGWRR